MPQNSDQSGQNWRGGQGKPQRKVKKAEWQQTSQAVVSTEGLGRKLRFIGLFGALFLCVAGLIVMYFWLSTPKAPLFVIIANPTYDEPGNIEAPLDFYGWKGAMKLAAWIKGAKDKEKPNSFAQWLHAQHTPNLLIDENPEPLPDKVHDLVSKISDKVGSSKFVFAYFGVFGSVNENDGPFLFATSGKPVTVKAILQAMKEDENLQKTKIVLFIDAARLHYAPRLGVIHNGFAAALQKVYQEVNPANIFIVSSSSANELAWDSEPAGSSVFLDRLMLALHKPDKGEIDLKELMSKLAEQAKWTSDRYVTKQTPMVLSKDGDLSVVKFPLLAENIEYKSDSAKLDDLRERLNAAWNLAQKVPGPEVYCPLSWRYYRELLLRYEKACLADDGKCAVKLKDSLKSLEAEIERQRKLNIGTAKNTTRAMKALAESNYGMAPASITDLASAKGSDDGGLRTAEAHFALMLKQFPKDTKPELDPELVAKAVQVRQSAELASLSLQESDRQKLYPYSERIWPFIHDNIVAADALRREGEDLVFASDEQLKKKSMELLTGAENKYKEAQTSVMKLQDAWRTYHEAASILPDLIMWRSYKSMLDDVRSGEDQKPYEECSAYFHSLQSRLSSITKENWSKDVEALAETASKIKKRLVEFKAEYEKDLLKACRSPREVFTVECALSIPFLVAGQDATKRLDSVKAANETARTFFSPSHQSAQDSLTVDWDQVARQRVKRMYALLQHDQKSDVATINELKLDGLPKHARIIRDDFLNLTDVEVKEYDKLPKYEMNSRMALAKIDPKAEPAVLLRTQQWERVLKDQAMRLALDHWYDQQQDAYYKRLVKDCLEGRKPDSTLQKILDDDTMDLASAQSVIPWTSELFQDVKFTLNKIPLKTQKGYITTWRTLTGFTNTATIEFGNKLGRQSMELSKGNIITVPLKLAESNNSNKNDNSTITQYAYFRGLLIPSKVDIDLFRQPSRIVTWQQPTERASFVVNSTGDLGVGLGHLAIVLDYSASMLEMTKPDKTTFLPDEMPDKVADRELTRIWKAINAFDGILANLPDETRISIHVFSDEESSRHFKGKQERSKVADLTKQTKCRSIVSGTLVKSENNTAIRTADGRLVGKSELVGQLKDLKPKGYTPLIQSIERSIQESLKESPIAHESLTVLVLTDGMDTSMGDLTDEPDAPTRNSSILSLSKKFEQILIDNVSTNIHMVFFQTDGDEKKICEMVFDKSKHPQLSSRVGFYYADTIEQLPLVLRNALRPRVRLLKADGDAVDLGDKQGWAVTPIGEKIKDIVCTPAIEPGNYTLVLNSNNNANQGQQIRLQRGDFMFLELGASKDRSRGLASFKRKLFVDVFEQESIAEGNRSSVFRQSKHPWYLCLVENMEGTSSQGQPYRTFAMTLENGSALSVDKNGRLQVNRPDSLSWWNVEFMDKDNNQLRGASPRTQVHNLVDNKSRYFAPASTIRFEGPIPHEAQKLAITVQNERDDTAENSIILKSCKDELKPTADKKYLVRCFHIEEYQRYNPNELFIKAGGKGKPALAVQVQLAPNQPEGPFQLQLEMKDGPNYDCIEHVYYDNGKGRSVTAYFCGVDKKDFEDMNDQARVNLVNMKAERITLNLTRDQAMSRIPRKDIPNFSKK